MLTRGLIMTELRVVSYLEYTLDTSDRSIELKSDKNCRFFDIFLNFVN